MNAVATAAAAHVPTRHDVRGLDTTGAVVQGFCPPWEIGAIEARVEKLARKARRLGLAEPTLEVGQPYQAAIRDRVAPAVLVDFQVHTPRVQVEGWRFVAALDQTPAGVVTRALDASADLSAYRDVEPSRCDHCKTSRRRKAAFVLRNEEGQEMVVGRNCLTDFLGRDAATGVRAAMFPHVARAELDDDYLRGWASLAPTLTPVGLLTVVYALMEVQGAYITSRQARDQGIMSTARVAADYIQSDPVVQYRDSRDVYEALKSGAEAYESEALAALSWAQGLDGESDFEANMRIVASNHQLDGKHVGICGYIAQAYRKAKAPKATEAAPKAREAAPKAYVGTVGARQEFEVTVLRKRVIESFYGWKTVVALRDADGNALVWFASGSTKGLEEGKTVRVKATVKDHRPSKLNGDPETILNRVAVLSD